MASRAKFRVAICGAGIGGLTTAVALSRYPDIEVQIYEAAEKLAEIGAGIGLWGRSWEIIRKLGLDEDLACCTETKPSQDPTPSFRYRKSDKPEGLEFYTLVTKGKILTFHRPDFQNVLLKHIPSSYRIHCSKRLRSYTQRQGGPITLLFEDGTRASCDVLLGADGLKSAVRRSLLGEKALWAQSQNRWSEAADITAMIEPVWSGTNAYRALIPADRLKLRKPDHRVFTQPTQYLGKNGYIIAYPISHGKMINFVAFKSQHDMEGSKFNGPWVCVTDKAEFASWYRDWEPEVQALVDCVDKPLRWAIHVVKPLGSYVSGNVAILGDAAHAATPHQGSGAGQAIEDAFILATLLGHPLTTRETLTRALGIYDHVRRPFAHKVYQKSRLNGQYFTLNTPEIDFNSVPDHELLAKLRILGQVFTKNWEWAWTTSLGSSVQEALRLLESS
ncbi:FAD-dependent monooxygenase str9 [Psilocybe cubensis]|uniref:FAD-dependent monooxygenase str9 n=2 Tax=Psilocybe cubensis TaxID=181762 RepID=A0ACB8GVC4_PSICU|nr:FAD-dependent monooxygenase str9 [Psilocybe cubensis]KAH9479171.1 FAD-dependent monooxygenase str9 [Psilocybe cubensis]